MRKILIIVLLIFFWSNISFSEIYNCEINKNYTFVIKTKNQEPQLLGSLELETGKFTEESIIYPAEIKTGELILFAGGKATTHDLIVLNDPDKKSDWSFRAIYLESPGIPYVTSIVIDYWDKNHPVYIYDDWNKRIAKGTCK